MDVLSYLDASGKPVENNLSRLVRLRPSKKEDPYNPESFIFDWDRPALLEFFGYIDTQEVYKHTEQTRTQLISTTSLIVFDFDLDIQHHDRIKDQQRLWTVTEMPKADRSPFSGWQPTRIFNMEEVTG